MQYPRDTPSKASPFSWSTATPGEPSVPASGEHEEHAFLLSPEVHLEKLSRGGGVKYKVVYFTHLMLEGSGACYPRNLDPLRSLLVHFQLTLHYV